MRVSLKQYQEEHQHEHQAAVLALQDVGKQTSPVLHQPASATSNPHNTSFQVSKTVIVSA